MPEMWRPWSPLWQIAVGGAGGQQGSGSACAPFLLPDAAFGFWFGFVLHVTALHWHFVSCMHSPTPQTLLTARTAGKFKHFVQNGYKMDKKLHRDNSKLIIGVLHAVTVLSFSSRVACVRWLLLSHSSITELIVGRVTAVTVTNEALWLPVCRSESLQSSCRGLPIWRIYCSCPCVLQH